MRVRKLVTLPVRLPLKLIKKFAPGLRLSRIDGAPVHPAETTSEVLPKKARLQRDSPPPLEECPICHDPVGASNPEGMIESWISLHCGHKFGDACIQTWLQDSLERDDPHNPNPTCPICRSVAKHPACGHPVCVVPTFEMQWNAWQQFQAAAATEAAFTTYRPPIRHRNRLQRREGHPCRPSFTPPSRTVDTIGKCTVCTELSKKMEREKRMMDMVQTEPALQEQEQEQVEEFSSLSRKSTVIHLRRGIRRANGSFANGEPSSPTTPMSRTESRAVRGRSMACNMPAPRIPTPTPSPGGDFMAGARPVSSVL